MPTLAQQAKEICRLFEINPSRSKGQNFLINEKIYQDIIKTAQIKSETEVLEVGPGLGFLTVELAKVAKRVVAVELDEKLYDYLQLGLQAVDNENVELVNLDILRFNPRDYFTKSYQIVANLPYNISSIFLRTFLSLRDFAPDSMVLMLQKEVALRIKAETEGQSLLSLSVAHYAKFSYIREVKAGNFWPEPEVDSAIIRLDLLPKKYQPTDDKLFFRLLKAGFSAKRKLLKNNLSGGLQLESDLVSEAMEKNQLDRQARAEDLSLTDWYNLFASLKQFML